ncbi:DUF805 domain-containing protein [Hyunsoonleella sp. SJ7]|uniref:DUF805 domain-containing protein n=1 Tax=Hyunsoonleella aquatilis TaxID=2762758 RepID=A0A923KL72_9FLAO|nr:DUF805 domain-containing protein [Hyunsoonleella aquatilis]MBC3757610.1 DUF805 domain-containing protein [Hyunsoonleella aquatilis]
MFKNPFSFEGRIRRLEYGLTYLCYIIITNLIEFLVNEYIGGDSALFVYLLVLIPLMWIMLAQGAKRCHDRGNSGWYQIIPFYVFWMVFADGEPGPNEYGDNPKGIGQYNEIDDIGKPINDEPPKLER